MAMDLTQPLTETGNLPGCVKHGWHVELISLASMSQLYRKCGILNFSEPYRPPQSVAKRVLLLFCD
jgi:hypothetical protein